MKFIIRILKALRYIVYSVGLFLLSILLSPVVMIFNWNKLWLLSIATEEDCSLDKALELSNSIPKYKFSRWNLNFPNYHAAGLEVPRRSRPETDDDGIESAVAKTTDHSYSYLPENIFYSDHYR